MKYFLFGFDATYMLVFSVITAILTIGFLCKMTTSESFKYHFISSYKFITLGLIGLTVISFCGSQYLDKKIDSKDALQLEKKFQESYFLANGDKFRSRLDSIAKDNGVVTTAELSYSGSDIHSDYVSKSDWNNLAKIYNSLK